MMEQDKKQTHLLIVGPVDFPAGSAPSSRIRAYARGIIENGGRATVVAFRPCHTRLSLPPEGVIDGIRYIYSCGTAQRPGSLLLKIYYEITGIIGAMRLISSIHAREKIDSILFFASDTLVGSIFTYWARRLGIPVFEERCELQFRDRKNLFTAARAWIHEHWVVSLFDGMVIMTDALESYYRPFMREGARILRMPILVDMARFEVSDTAPQSRYIAYCGTPSGDKDGVPILIDAFAKTAAAHPDLRLVIIGDYRSADEKETVAARIRALGIENRVEITGRKPPEEIPKYLCSASLLALARPANLQAAYGFPTKLGEYLAAGRPVVVTRVGEIDQFLQDGINAYIAEPDSADSFSQKLNEALGDPMAAAAVGAAGKEVARKYFAYKQHGKRWLDFIRVAQASKLTESNQQAYGSRKD